MFLRHGILSLAAKHLQHSSPPNLKPFYSELASQHQYFALEKYIPQLGSITEQNHHAIFAFSLLLAPLRHSFLATSDAHFHPQGVIAQVIENFEYLIGSTVISSSTDSWIRKGVLSPILTVRKLESVIPQLHEEPHNTLNILMNEIQRFEAANKNHSPLSPNQGALTTRVSTYKRAIEVLSNSFPTIDGSPRYRDVTMGWPFFVGPDFMRLLKERDSLALVILGYYGVALHSYDHVWWLNGLGARLVVAVCHTISPMHIHLMQWPLAKIRSS